MCVDKRVMISLMAMVAVLLSAPTVWAGPNDVRLSQFGEFEEDDYDGCVNTCGVVNKDEAGFEAFAADLGQVFAPRLLTPAETLGEAGFAINFMTSFSTVPHTATAEGGSTPYWETGLERADPDPVLFTSHLQVRKGLPFSFEVVGNLAYLYASEMFAMGADLRWALNEGFDYFPDVAVRGSVNTIVGAPELNLVNAGWDLSASKSFGLAGVASITPYLGYQQLYTIFSTRVLNAYPQDPRPPQFSQNDLNVRFAPEFVFSQDFAQSNRVFVGGRLNTWILSFTLEAVFGGSVNQYTFAGGFDF